MVFINHRNKALYNTELSSDIKFMYLKQKMEIWALINP